MGNDTRPIGFFDSGIGGLSVMLCAMEPVSYTHLIASGISHVLALSGLHIGIIIFGLFYFLKRIKAPYYLTIVLTLTALLAYLMLTGMKISAVRAGVLCVRCV